MGLTDEQKNPFLRKLKRFKNQIQRYVQIRLNCTQILCSALFFTFLQWAMNFTDESSYSCDSVFHYVRKAQCLLCSALFLFLQQATKSQVCPSWVTESGSSKCQTFAQYIDCVVSSSLKHNYTLVILYSSQFRQVCLQSVMFGQQARDHIYVCSAQF